MLNIYTQNNHNGKEEAGRDGVPANGKKLPKPNFEKYVDPSGELTTQRLKWGIWYAEHRVLVYRAVVGTLAVFIVATWGYALWQLGNYFIFGIAADQVLERQLGVTYDYTSIHAHYSPAPLQVGNPEAFAGGVNKYDIASEVTNPNPRFLVEFDYYFAVLGTTTARQHAVFIPDETRPVAFFGVESDGYPGGAEIFLENVRWSRVDAHLIPDTRSWQAARLNFAVTDFKFTSDREALISHANVIEFTLKNNSAYGYKTPRFYAVLSQNGATTAIIPFSLENFASLEERQIDLRSFASGLSATEVEVYPVIDVYDWSVYLAPSK